ncbi:MAG TPA: cation diffusion facilitator family transporter [Gammaproteobacteria bacterium]|nr:cation diffusion facilitator family transporter [Gammaproteobacteria bacterium]
MASDPAPVQSDKLLRRATYASVVTATVLIVAKFAAWAVTGSVSVLASLVDSLMDLGASGVNLIAVRYSLAPPDAEHRFGHGKAESLAGLAQATFITGSAVFLIIEAVGRLLHPRALQDIGIGIAVMVFSIAVTITLLLIQRRVIRATGSTAIRADALHYGTDLATGVSVILALALAYAFGWNGLDAWFAIAIAVYILVSAGKIGWQAFQVLLDRELPDSDRARIAALAEAHPDVLGMHDLRTRQSGRLPIVQLHLEIDARRSLADAHRIAKEVETAILQAFPHADVTIHQDPVDQGRAGTSPRPERTARHDQA